jgi:bifunctional non-homologous end joining protein LigD
VAGPVKSGAAFCVLMSTRPRHAYNWADRYPRIVDALRALRVRSIVIDGEAVWCGPDGRSDFDWLHSRAHDATVILYAFDLIELNGEDLRSARADAVIE